MSTPTVIEMADPRRATVGATGRATATASASAACAHCGAPAPEPTPTPSWRTRTNAAPGWPPALTLQERRQRRGTAKS